VVPRRAGALVLRARQRPVQEEKAKAATPARQRRFNEQTPPSRRFVKTDVARYQHTWELKPHLVCFGSQKNFDLFTQELRTRRSGWVPDETWYRELIAKAILYRSAERAARDAKLPAYRTQVATYLTALLVDRSGSRLDLEAIWKHQGLTPQLVALLASWVESVLAAATGSAAGRNVTEWCKKRECWDAVRQAAVPMPAVLPPELSGGLATAPGGTTTADGVLVGT
jgi:AIPR protein